MQLSRCRCPRPGAGIVVPVPMPLSLSRCPGVTVPVSPSRRRCRFRPGCGGPHADTCAAARASRCAPPPRSLIGYRFPAAGGALASRPSTSFPLVRHDAGAAQCGRHPAWIGREGGAGPRPSMWRHGGRGAGPRPLAGRGGAGGRGGSRGSPATPPPRDGGTRSPPRSAWSLQWAVASAARHGRPGQWRLGGAGAASPRRRYIMEEGRRVGPHVGAGRASGRRQRARARARERCVLGPAGRCGGGGGGRRGSPAKGAGLERGRGEGSSCRVRPRPRAPQ